MAGSRPPRSRLTGFVWAFVAAFVAVLPAVAQPAKLPAPFAHIVIVVEENHSASDIIGNPQAPYLNQLMAEGALFTHAYGVEHPSQPNYLDLFSGGNQGVYNDSCPHTFTAANLGFSLLHAGKSFAGYSEDLPYTGYTGCASGTYRRKHSPWVNFSNLPATVNLPMSAFPAVYSSLPTLSFVIPGLETDMHSGPIGAADEWLKIHLSRYVRWAKEHNSLLVVTWDESERRAGNHIPLVFVGAHVKPGRYGQRVTHFSLLRTIEDIYHLPPIGASAEAKPITGVWK